MPAILSAAPAESLHKVLLCGEQSNNGPLTVSQASNWASGCGFSCIHRLSTSRPLALGLEVRHSLRASGQHQDLAAVPTAPRSTIAHGSMSSERPPNFDDSFVSIAHQLADAAARVTRGYFRYAGSQAARSLKTFKHHLIHCASVVRMCPGHPLMWRPRQMPARSR